MLYRLFPHAPGARSHDEWGPLHVARAYQGWGRHDNPDAYGALYLSRQPAAAVAERLRRLLGRELSEARLHPGGRTLALAEIDESELGPLPDLDDPAELLERGLRPSMVASRERDRTQPIALAAFEEGRDGLAWWSTVESSWTNVTLFAERALPKLSLAGDPEPLSMEHPAVAEAVEALGLPTA